jgi:2,3-bisphosphoglycerate-dependent phosphoglycerate mutase
MPRLVATLVRHGDYQQPPGVPSAHLPQALTDGGRHQAREEAAALRHWAAEQGLAIHEQIACSHMRRAYETATLFAEVLSGPDGQEFSIVEDDALAERCVGAMANLTVDQIAAIVVDDPRYPPLPEGWKADSHFRLPFQGAESMLDAGHRVATFVEQRLSALESTVSRDTLHLFIGHGGAFRHAAGVLGLLDLDEIRKLSMHHCRPVHLERRGPANWSHVGGEWKRRRSTTD